MRMCISTYMQPNGLEGRDTPSEMLMLNLCVCVCGDVGVDCSECWQTAAALMQV